MGRSQTSVRSPLAWRITHATKAPALALAGIAVVLGVWWLIALQLGPVRLPTPGQVWDALRADFNNVPAVEFSSFQTGGIKVAVGYTVVNVIVGVGIGSVAGFLVGALLGTSRAARELLSLPLTILSTMPVLILAPFLVIWFGTARIVQAGLVIMFAFVTLAAVVRGATEDVSGHYRNYAASLGAGRGMTLREVILPAVVPPTIGGVRVALATGWSFEAVAELLGGSRGTGKLIQTLQGMSATADIMAALAALAIVGVAIDTIVAAAGKWVIRWQE
ncbi:MAG: sulfonate transport system permease protein [Solirubrobacteraceae bacterium]|jgi:ABC-type nitrate/sulfonate/bicarbonate transport system permease component|nr:sulfonate transport system permease protein [Solirubrobacteraceae bacterium]